MSMLLAQKWIGPQNHYYNKYAIYYPDKIVLIKLNGSKEVVFCKTNREIKKIQNGNNVWATLSPEELEQLKIEML